MDETTLRKVRAKLDHALKANRDDEALVLLEQLSAADSDNARWPHKYGDLLRKHKRIQEAVLAYADAADIYAATGFPARASAMAKTVLSLDPKRIDVLERVDPIAAQQIRRQAERETTWFRHRAKPTQPIANPAADKRRPSVADLSIPVAPAPTSGSTAQGWKHPMVLDDNAPSQHVPVRPPGGKRRVDPRREPDPARSAPARETVEMPRPTRAQPARPTLQGRRHQPPPPPPAEAMLTARDAARPMATKHIAPVPAADDDEPLIIIEDESAPVSPPVVRSDAGAPSPTPSVAVQPAAVEPSPTPSVAAPAKKAVTLDRLSVPPPRWGQANWEPAPAEATAPPEAASQSAAPLAAAASRSSLPAAPARANDLAPPRVSATTGWFAGELPTGQLSQPAAAPSENAPEPELQPEVESPAPRVSMPPKPTAESQIVRVSSAPPPTAADSQPARANLSPKSAAEILDAGELFSRALETAAQLLTAPDATPPEPEPEVELGTEPPTEIEIPPDPVDDQGVIHAALPSELAMFPLFAELDSDALADVIASIDSIELPDGAYVLQRGELSDSLYGIIRGSVTVLGADQSYQLTLTDGDLFGESCLLKNEPRHADVRVKGELCAVRIPRRALFQVLRRKPKLAEHLLELLTRRLLGSFLLSSTLFRELGVESRRALARLFEMRLFPAGTVFATCGKPMDNLCIALTGQLTVEKPGFVPIVAPAGYVFGQHTLFSNSPAPSTVTARVNMVVLRLPAVALRQLAARHPTIRVHLAGLSTGQLTRVNL